jgi:excisionase family DNA binding protein
MDDDRMPDLEPWLEEALESALRNDWPSEPPDDATVIQLRGLPTADAVRSGGEPDDRTLLLTVDEAARMLRCGRTTVYQLIRTGELTTVKIGALRRVRLADVEAYVDRKVAEVPLTPYSARRTGRGAHSKLPPNWPSTRVSGE